jgi:hypothetical protein
VAPQFFATSYLVEDERQWLSNGTIYVGVPIGRPSINGAFRNQAKKRSAWLSQELLVGAK